MFNDTIEEVGRAKAKNIITNRHPYGKYWLLDVSGVYIGIDNSAGDAWTEEFGTKEECLAWLKGESNAE